MLVGIVGPLSAGKTTVGHLFEKEGFSLVSLSDHLREETEQQDRETLRALGNALREEHGPAILMEKALARSSGDTIFDGIRNPAEVTALQDSGGQIILVDADPKLRYDRAMARGKDTKMSFDAFIEMEAKEESAKATEQQLHILRNLADFVILNDGAEEELADEVTRVVLALRELPK
ncbi:MAG: AAA family ATPase [Candidatus Woesearchaeota archaeon]|nr:AAA family ATPase [Candidatus Woesearchaeota archaeon]